MLLIPLNVLEMNIFLVLIREFNHQLPQSKYDTQIVKVGEARKYVIDLLLNHQPRQIFSLVSIFVCVSC